MIQRETDEATLREFIDQFPVVAILGPRQSGKTTLARALDANHYFDLENPSDLALLSDAKLALNPLSGLIVVDEIQRCPDLFPVMRYLVDSHPNQHYLILGSASRDLIRQSSESLAGRIAYHELGGFRLEDIGSEAWRTLWLRGGLPLSYLAGSETRSRRWRDQYVASFLERDLPQLGITIPAPTLRRFWTMMGHYHGQVVNYAEFARSFGVSDMTIRRYLDILAGTFMVRLLQPWHANIGKRLVKRPKLYVRDTGLLHALMSVTSERDLAAYNRLGASWEGFALEAAIRTIGKRNEEVYFWATHSGAELDLFWQEHGRNWGVEVKYTSSPRLTPSMTHAIQDLNLEHLWVVYPGDKSFPLSNQASAIPITSIGPRWKYPI